MNFCVIIVKSRLIHVTRLKQIQALKTSVHLVAMRTGFCFH